MIDINALKRDKRPQSAWVVHALIDHLEVVENERDDLLEALRALETLFAPLARDSTTATWIDKARAAITRATGEKK